MNFDIKKYLKEARVLLLLIIIAFTVKSTLIEIYVVPTGSMENEILVGDLLIGNKFTYGMRTPNWIGIPYTRIGFDIPYTRLPGFKSVKNGDVAMFEYPRDPFQKYVKRCIGIPSDTISIIDGEILVNGKIMPFPENAKYVSFKEADLNNDGWINQLDYNMINPDNSRRFQVALRKAQFTVKNQANVFDTLFNTNSTILLDKDYQLNPYKENFVYSSNNKDYPTIQEQYLMGTIYPYFDGNTDNIEPFVVPSKDMIINFKDWYNEKNEWISLITLLVQDGNKVTLDGIEFVMEDPESVAQISGILKYKLFPNPQAQRENYHNIKNDLKIKNKRDKKDNPWNIYDNPFLYTFEQDISLVKSIDLNQDKNMDENDLVNDQIYKSFIEKYSPDNIQKIINKSYDGSTFLFGLNFYKEFVDKYIYNNLMVNGVNIADLKNYQVLCNYYLFIGDNRDNSLDSRFWGFVPDYQILGTPLLSLLNISKFKIRFKTIN
tara:strand:- start:8735 stop:10204 length:1470 start_codon:yes stop_codon:yes gene_type:complete